MTTVAELIEDLRTYHPDDEVVAVVQGGNGTLDVLADCPHKDRPSQ